MTAHEPFDAIVIGAGPVGLFGALALARQNLRVLVLERRGRPSTDSRAIGIHPPALARADALGVGATMRERGLAVDRGHACTRDAVLGTVSFSQLPGSHPFVLTLPQDQTEALLERALASLANARLCRGATCLDVCLQGSRATVRYRDARGETSATARFVIAADGHASLVRDSLGIAVHQRHYADTFLMGDFPDETGWCHEARIFFASDGWVESFPLPGGIRRWVASVPESRAKPDADRLRALVAHRTGHVLRPKSCLMRSAFGIVQQRARDLVRGAVVLIGDAAHVISPIGGQGMNLGWLGAWELAQTLGQIHRGERDRGPALADWAQRRHCSARIAMQRAAFNMAIGRPGPAPALRNIAVRLLLRGPLHDRLARMFTMHDL